MGPCRLRAPRASIHALLTSVGLITVARGRLSTGVSAPQNGSRDPSKPTESFAPVSQTSFHSSMAMEETCHDTIKRKE